MIEILTKHGAAKYTVEVNLEKAIKGGPKHLHTVEYYKQLQQLQLLRKNKKQGSYFTK